jgi:hypothetical protein
MIECACSSAVWQEALAEVRETCPQMAARQVLIAARATAAGLPLRLAEARS